MKIRGSQGEAPPWGSPLDDLFEKTPAKGKQWLHNIADEKK